MVWLGYFFIFAGLAIHGQAAVTPLLVGDGSAPLLGGVLGDGGGLPRDHDHVALVLVAVHLVLDLLHHAARARLRGRV